MAVTTISTVNYRRIPEHQPWFSVAAFHQQSIWAIFISDTERQVPGTNHENVVGARQLSFEVTFRRFKRQVTCAYVQTNATCFQADNENLGLPLVLLEFWYGSIALLEVHWSIKPVPRQAFTVQCHRDKRKEGRKLREDDSTEVWVLISNSSWNQLSSEWNGLCKGTPTKVLYQRIQFRGWSKIISAQEDFGRRRPFFFVPCGLLVWAILTRRPENLNEILLLDWSMWARRASWHLSLVRACRKIWYNAFFTTVL